MSEPGAVGPLEEREGERHGSPEEHLPQVGREVAGYRLERRVGAGGQGTVFRASREGRPFAVKFIFLPRSARWGWRELDVLVKRWPAGGPLLEGCGLWPAQQPRFLFLVTPYVPGLPLDTWTRLHNPTALQVARLVLQAARQLQPVHKAGVVHRDVKGANLLVDEEERLVLVDFGVATYEGAPAVTGAFPPGSWSYLSPRVWRAWRGEEDSRPCPGDDVWSLGVELYQSLTGRLPFQGREEVLVQAILHEEPRAPHEANPRVPRALGELCLRMLRKQPGERFADARALDAALEEALKQADAAWQVPLGEAWGPHLDTTGALLRSRPPWSPPGPRPLGVTRSPPLARGGFGPPGRWGCWACAWGSPWACFRAAASGPPYRWGPPGPTHGRSQAPGAWSRAARKWRPRGSGQKVTAAQRPKWRQPLRPSPMRRAPRTPA